MIGDDFQLAPPVFTGSEVNPFYKSMEYSTFARFRDLGMPAFLLTDQMRMPAGMMHMSNSIIYGGKLRDGLGTALTEMPKAQDLIGYFSENYPNLIQEPEGLIYPVMLNVHGESQTEGNGTSVFNAYNVAATIEEIITLIRGHSHANASNVAIATPYRAQIRKYRRALAKAGQEYPDLNLPQIRVGTAEYWQGSELSYMFIDFVRASNDAGTLGFVSDAKTLIYIITRQTVGLWVICDERCVLTLGQQAERDNPIESSEGNEAEQVQQAGDDRSGRAEKKSLEDRRNATVIAMLDWLRQKGRVLNVAKKSLTERYVTFSTPENQKDQGPVGWSDPPVSTATANAAPAENATAFSTWHMEEISPADTDWNTTADETLLEGGGEWVGGSW